MRKKLVAGNWKMHGSLAQNAALLDAIKVGVEGLGCDVAVCPPYPYLAQVQSALSGTTVAWGGQSVSEHAIGAFTAEVSATMLADFGCRYVLVGHSERRAMYGETDALVAAKFAAAQCAGLVPILCVGETLAEREAEMTELVVYRQLGAVIEACGIRALESAVVAYEPVWAIGTGLAATSEQAQEVHAFIRKLVAEYSAEVAATLLVLYGGSVKGSNAAELLGQADIDGALVGGASLNADDFAAIFNAA